MRRFQNLGPDLFLWTDICNVYVLRDGDAALLIDLGDGSVLEHLHQIGVRRVEWVLYTHHHREQCHGHALLQAWQPQVAAPEAERALFEKPRDYRRAKVTLGDPMTVYGASYVRPPLAPIALDRTFKSMDDFTWRGREFWCVDTRGHSPGGMSYLLQHGGQRWAFCGDAICGDGKLHNWFDSEWDYGFGAGIYALFAAASYLERFDPQLLLPSHGPVLKDPQPALAKLQARLRRLAPLYLRGYELNTFAAGDQDNVSRPTVVPYVWQITPHLYKFKGTNFWPNFTILIADDGHGLIVDCGLFDPKFLQTALERMHERLGLKQIDAIFVTHAHGDHFLESEPMRERWKCELWTMHGVHGPCESPEEYDLCAPIQSYGSSAERGIERVRFDRLFAAGSFFEWHGYTFSVDWMPGQTKYACCLHGEIDGRRVAFTGDNIFASATDPKQNGHEAVVARNHCILEEGYLQAATFLHGIGPDLLIGGHSWVIDQPAELIERYRQTALDLREAFRELSIEDDYRYMFDPYWVRAEPYRVFLSPGGRAECAIVARSFLDRPQTYRVDVVAPRGFSVWPNTLELTVGPQRSVHQVVEVQAALDAPEGPSMIALDITRGGKRYGPMFDFVAIVGDSVPPSAATPAKDKPGY